MRIRDLSLCALVVAVAILTSADSCNNNFSINVVADNNPVNTGATTTLTAVPQNNDGNVTYTWSLSGSNCSTACGTLSTTTGSTVTYTAPANVPLTGKVTATANAVDKNSDKASGSVQLTITGTLSVSVTPAFFSFSPGGAPQSFSATVVNDPTAQGVSWSLSVTGVDCAAASAPCGTLSNATSSSVTYAPPASLAAAEQVALTATPLYDTKITASAILSISAGGSTPLTLSISPTSATVNPGGSPVSFMANISGTGSSQGVTWRLSQNGSACAAGASSPCGTLSSTSTNPVTYTPPASVSGSSTVTLTATAVAQSSVTSFVTITIQPATTQSLYPRYLFEVNNDNTISSYAVVPSTGQLRAVTHFAAPPQTIEAAGFNPVANVIYIIENNNVSGGNATVATLPVTASGQISDGGENFNGNLDGGAGTIAVDPLGRYLYGTDSVDGQIALYSLNSSSGLPTVEPGTAVSPKAKQLAIDSTGTFLYVEDSNENLLGYQIGTNGALTSVGSAPSSHPSSGGPIAVDPQNVYFVAVDNNSKPQLYAYALSNGALQPVPSSPFNLGAAGGFISEIAIDPTGTYLYAIDVANNQLIGVVNDNGVFTPITGSPFTIPSGGVPKQLSVDPTGKYVYVAFEDTQEVWAYTIATGGSAPGSLTLASKMRLRTSVSFAQLISAGSQPVTFTPQYLYVANSGTANIGQFSITPSSGELTSLGAPVTSGNSPYDVAASSNPAEPYVYSANQGANNISGYQIGSNGALTALTTSPYLAGNSPEWLVVDPSGANVFNVNSADATLTAFDITSSSGELFSTLLGGNTSQNPVHVSMDPNGIFAFSVNSPASPAQGSVTSFNVTVGAHSPSTVAAGNLSGVGAVHPSGEFFYVANGDNTISEYAINASTGALTSFGTVTVAASGPATYNFVVIEPSGNYLYYSDQVGNLIYIFSINPETGALTPASTPSVSTSVSPYAMTVDISGAYLYVSNLNAGNISIYSIDLTNGNLTAVGGGPVSTGGTFPRGMTSTGTLQ
jgi:6-phosphogluconolactonase (cycloisomerase 2 family)